MAAQIPGVDRPLTFAEWLAPTSLSKYNKMKRSARRKLSRSYDRYVKSWTMTADWAAQAAGVDTTSPIEAVATKYLDNQQQTVGQVLGLLGTPAGQAAGNAALASVGLPPVLGTNKATEQDQLLAVAAMEQPPEKASGGLSLSVVIIAGLAVWGLSGSRR